MTSSQYEVHRDPRKIYLYILFTGFVIWIAETAAFGFNRTPQNGLEAFLDALSGGMMAVGFIGDLFEHVSFVKHFTVKGDYHSLDNRTVHSDYVKIDASKANINYIMKEDIERAAKKLAHVERDKANEVKVGS